MRRNLFGVLLFAVLLPNLSAQNNPHTLHIQGPQAHRLISLLVSGNDSIASSFRDSRSNSILLHDLMVLKWSTYKYDEDAAMCKLDVYSANAKIGDAAQLSPLHEAASLYALLDSLGIRHGLSMQGDDLDADTVDCRIDTNLSFGNPKRFVCNLALPF